jgi:nucleoside-diphosphate-sugar epimerase
VLVTGATGFVGRPTVAALAGEGFEVHALSSRLEPPAVAGVQWHRADLRSDLEVDALLADLAPEQLLHMAWEVQPGRFWDAPENLLWVERSLHLVRAFAEAGGRRAVLLGTCAEYDWSRARAPLEELTSPLAPSTLYGVAKDALRRVLTAYAEQVGFELAWGRLFFLYGPREAPGRLVSSLITSLLAGEPVATTAGAQRRDFMHVDDVAGGIAALLASGVTGPVNLASGVARTVAEVVDQIALATGRGELIERGALADRPGEPALLVADTTRLRDEVGFTQRIDLADGIADAVEWWRAQSSEGPPAAATKAERADR